MEAGLATRSAIILASFLAGVWMLVPTFSPPAVRTELERVCKLEAMKEKDRPKDAAPGEWYTSVLPCHFLVKGLDLQGGVDMTMYVDVDEAVRSTVSREAAHLEAAAKDKNVDVVEARRDRHEPILLVLPGPNATTEQVKTLVLDRLERYEFTGTRVEGDKTWVTFAMKADRVSDIRKQSVDQAREKIESRINGTGVKEPTITRKGETGIDVQLPGETDIEAAKEAIGTTAQLGFLLVDESFKLQTLDGPEGWLAKAKAAMPEADFNNDLLLSQWLEDQKVLTPKQRLYWYYDDDAKPPVRKAEYLVLHSEILLTGEDVDTAGIERDSQKGGWDTSLDFKPRGAKIFGDITGANIHKRLAIVLDDHIRSAPQINGRIDGRCSISGSGLKSDDVEQREASTLALVLRTGALPAPVNIGEVRTIGPQLGDKAIREGTFASLLGCVLVFLFAGIYYRVSGLLADISLALNGLLCVALLVWLGATLTLPGICGIALTIGMAVDANIIIFERIREELRGGKSARTAIETGFDRASVAVIDSNICTLLAGVVLFSYGTGPLRGFAVTLLIGIFTTLFTGVFVSRTLMEAVFGRRSTANVSI